MINPKQEKFCHEWIKDRNGKRSAIEAGYSAKTAEQQASRLLRDVKIKAYIKELMKPTEEKNKKEIADIQEVLAFFTKVMRGQEKDQFDLDAALQDRIKAGQELARRYEKADKTDEEKTALDKLVTIIKGVDKVAER